MSLIYEKCLESANYIKTKMDAEGAIGIILGSGLGNLANEIEDPVTVEYKDIPNFPVPTVAGHAGALVCGQLNGVKVLCMQGRFHFYEGHDMKTVSMPVRVMKLLGCKAAIITNAAGGVNRSFDEGTLMIIDDFINYMGDNPLVGENAEEFGPRFPDMTHALSEEYKQKAKQAAEQLGIKLEKGVYMAFRGPNYETPAEIRFAAVIGADAVGMSTVPELLAASHCSLPVVGISCITNMAAGITGKALSHEEVSAVANRVNGEFKALIKKLVTLM